MSRNGRGRKRASDDNGWAERGGYMAAKVSKLDEQFKMDAPREKEKDGSCTDIFSGVSIYVNGYTDPSADELRRLMMLHGGQFHVYYSRSKTTHIIATNLPNSKVQELRDEKVVRPEWITDSVKAGRLLSYLQYQLYAKQKVLSFAGASVRPPPETTPSGLGRPPPGLHGPPPSHRDLALPHRNHSPQYPGDHHPPHHAQPGQNSPPDDLFNPQLSRLTPDPYLGHPGHPGQPPPVRGHSPPAYTPPRPSLSSGQRPHHHHELDVRLNGSLRGPPSDQTGPPRVNGVQEGDGEGPASPVRPPVGGVKEPQPSPLTNGHVHPVNGALKPLDLSPASTRLASDPPGPDPAPTSDQVSVRTPNRLRHPCRRQSPERKSPGFSGPPSPPSRRLTEPEPPRHLPPERPAALPPSANEPPHQTPKLPPPTYEQAVAASESHRLQPRHQKPRPSPPGLDRAHSPFASPTPLPLPPSSPSPPVRLNGGHRSSAFPAHDPDPAPPGGPDQSAKPGGGIISEFYSHSRLHHISTWRSEFSEYVNALQSRRRAAGGATFPGRDRLRRSTAHKSAAGFSGTPSMQSCILHVDMDCFFVSVGIRHRPDLRGKPVAVTSNRGRSHVAQRPGANPELEQQYYQRKHTYPRPESEEEEIEDTPEPDRSVSHGNGVDQDTATLSRAEIASCSYEARQAGVRNGMYFGQAKQLCPSLQSVPYDFQAYKEVALTMYETLASYTHDIEALSCDEALLDGSALLAELGVTPDELAGAIRADVRERTGCCASVGMGSNILLARMAIRKAKPDGQYLLRSEEVDDFLREQSVTSLPGVGRSMGAKLASLGVRSCGDLQQVTLQRLQRELGPRTGQTLYRFCRGLDDRPVRTEKERKSVSAEMNYNIRFTQAEEAETFLTNLSMEVQRRLQGAGLRGRRVTLKVMVRKPGAPVEPAKYGGHGICDNLARSVTMAQPTDSGQLIASEVIRLFHTMGLEVQEMRGIGLQVQLLQGAHPVPQDPTGRRTRSIKDMLLGPRAKPNSKEPHPVASAAETTLDQEEAASSARVPPPCPSPRPFPSPPAEAIAGTSRGAPPPPAARTPNHAHTRLNLSIEVPSPSQVDRSVLEALPPELREQVEQSWTHRERRPNNNNSTTTTTSLHPPPSVPLRPASPPPPPPLPSGPPVGTLVLQIPNQTGQPGSTGIILELPDFSQVDPEVFAALPRELQEELRSAYNRRGSATPQGAGVEHRNPLLQLKQLGVGVGRVKRRYKRKNTGSPSKKGPSPLKRPRPGNSPVKALPHALRARDATGGLKTENAPSTSSPNQDIPEERSKFTPRPAPALAGACDFTDIRTLLQEWVTTISEPMEEDILQVVKYCTDLIEDKDLEKLDLVIKYMKRLMQQSDESVWSMAFDFILDNVQMVVQQAYGSTLKIS